MRPLILLAAIGASLLAPPSALPAQDLGLAADPQEAGFEAFLPALGQRAAQAGVSRATIDSVLPTLTYNPRVVELDQSQPGGTAASPTIPAFAPYKARHVDGSRIARGRAAWQRSRGSLARIEAETGVPEAVMVAIWGNESDYSGNTGDFDLARSLATLAYEGRRRELFTAEFIATLQLIDRGVPRSRLKGSWAGATGYPQFLPSVYLRLARDGDGDGRADIWGSEADTLASIGNYLVNAGWKPNVPWGVAAVVPAGLDRAALASRMASPRCPRVFARHTRWLSVGEWRRLGVVPVGSARLADSEQASLLEPDGPGATAYLLTTNYRAILDYNCSNFYALSVGLLADAVGG